MNQPYRAASEMEEDAPMPEPKKEINVNAIKDFLAKLILLASAEGLILILSTAFANDHASSFWGAMLGFHVLALAIVGCCWAGGRLLRF